MTPAAADTMPSTDTIQEPASTDAWQDSGTAAPVTTEDQDTAAEDPASATPAPDPTPTVDASVPDPVPATPAPDPPTTVDAAVQDPAPATPAPDPTPTVDAPVQDPAPATPAPDPTPTVDAAVQDPAPTTPAPDPTATNSTEADSSGSSGTGSQDDSSSATQKSQTAPIGDGGPSDPPTQSWTTTALAQAPVTASTSNASSVSGTGTTSTTIAAAATAAAGPASSPSSTTGGPTAPSAAATVATVVHELAALGNQLGTVAVLDARLQRLIVVVVSLTGLDSVVSSLLAQLEQAGNSAPTVGSLVAKVVLLDRLLRHLARVNPAAARRLASALPELRKLMTKLLSSARHAGMPALPGPLSTSQAAANMLEPLVGKMDPRADTSLSGALQGSPVLVAAETPPVQALSPVLHTRATGSSSVRHSSRSGSGRTTSPLSSPPLTGGGVGSASGGLGAAAGAAGGMLVVSAMWLLNTFFCRRTELDLVPRRAAFLAARPERPG